MQLAGDPIAGLVEMANLGLGQALADGLVDVAQRSRLLSHPSDNAGRADQRRAKKIAQGLRGPILGDELMDVEVDRRGLDALAVLRRRDHAFRKRRLRYAPTMHATIDRGLMFRDQQRALGKIEHLALLDPYRRRLIERRTTMAARAGLVSNRVVGIGHLPQPAAIMALLTAARLARTTAKAAGDPRLLAQPVTRRRLGAVRAVQTQSTPKFGNLRPKPKYLRPKRSYQILNFGGKRHPTLDSDSTVYVCPNPASETKFIKPVAFRTHLGLGVTFRLVSNSPAALEGYVALSGALNKGTLPAATGERIALAVAQINGCDYCLSAHTYLGKNLAKLDDAEIAANRNGASTDPKADAAVRFAAKVTRERGHVDETDVLALKGVGYSDAQVVEIVLLVALNTFTNYINEVAKTEIDFPVVTAAKAA
jgi:uncharacterized peroxidase-related enzyme